MMPGIVWTKMIMIYIFLGTVRHGIIKEGDELLAGPSDEGKFYPVIVSSLHRNKTNCRFIQAGQTACIAMKQQPGEDEPLEFRRVSYIIPIRTVIWAAGPSSFGYLVYLHFFGYRLIFIYRKLFWKEFHYTKIDFYTLVRNEPGNEHEKCVAFRQYFCPRTYGSESR